MPLSYYSTPRILKWPNIYQNDTAEHTDWKPQLDASVLNYQISVGHGSGSNPAKGGITFAAWDGIHIPISVLEGGSWLHPYKCFVYSDELRGTNLVHCCQRRRFTKVRQSRREVWPSRQEKAYGQAKSSRSKIQFKRVTKNHSEHLSNQAQIGITLHWSR